MTQKCASRGLWQILYSVTLCGKSAKIITVLSVQTLPTDYGHTMPVKQLIFDLATISYIRVSHIF